MKLCQLNKDPKELVRGRTQACNKWEVLFRERAVLVTAYGKLHWITGNLKKVMLSSNIQLDITWALELS